MIAKLSEMVAPSRLRWVWFCLGLFTASAGLAQVAGGLLPDFRGAERELAGARRELQEIAGSDLFRKEAPPLPGLRVEDTLALLEEEMARVDRLLEAGPEDWTSRDREWVASLLPVDLALRVALAGGGEGEDREPDEGEGTAGPEELAARTLAPLRATRVVALGDRLALLDGDFSAFLDGVELREWVAERYLMQPGLVGSGLGSGMHLEALRDLRVLVARPEVPHEALDRVNVHLLRWRQVVPSPAVVAATEGLSILDRGEDLPGELGGVGDAAVALFLAPLARDLADLARICRETGCAAAAAFLDRRREDSDDRFRVIAQMMTPDVLGLVLRLEVVATLTEVARVAVGLRLEALDAGGYPSTEGLPGSVAVELDAIEGLGYERVAGGARLRFDSEELLSRWPETLRARLEPLLVWELPKARSDAGDPRGRRRE